MENTPYQLPVWETLQTGWDKIYGIKAKFWLAVGVYVLALFVAAIIVALVESADTQIGWIMQFVFKVYTYVLSIGLAYIGYQCINNTPIKLSMLFRGVDDPLRMIKILLANLLTYLIYAPFILISIGLPFLAFYYPTVSLIILACLLSPACLIAVVYISMRLSLKILFILVHDAGPVDALYFSFKATENNVLRLFFIYLILGISFILGLYALLIGLIWMLPFLVLCQGLIYKRLEENKEK